MARKRSVSIGFQWVVPPEELAKAIERYARGVRANTEQVMENFGRDLEAHMKANRPWTDRTGAARRGLTADVERQGEAVSVILYHTVPYGVYLELAHGGRFAILGPTIEEKSRELRRMLRGVGGQAAARRAAAGGRR